MDEFLSFVTIDVWTLVFVWINLFILYLLMKKFLFKPVTAIIEKRKNEISKAYEIAQEAQVKADTMKNEYKEKLSNAKQQAEEIMKNANQRAIDKEEEIVKEAHDKATHILQKADEQVALQKKSAINEIKNEISGMATLIAEKVIEKDINEDDHKRFIDDFINEIGDLS